MEAMKMKIFMVALIMVLVAMSGIQNVAAMEAPAPAPASDSSIFVPTIFASLVALVFGLFF
ncbi:arabinogalactan protein 14-like [Nicotiana tomentosiformis]|uniref:arabinogalactan protein 14-like n=1 Tax=Nicotiana tomentosiformis TaxID=4098 RepID=UPI00051B90BB|nr:arabinogalactan protein 14-like [Nicotiana tomentosiformis]